MESPRIKRSTVWILAGLLLLGFLTRLHTYNEPLETDIAEYAVVSHELLNGQQLYSDLFQQRPPLIYATYALAEKLVGYGQQEAFFLGWLAFALTLLGVYRAGSLGRFGERGGIWAALFWSLISADMILQANQPNTEVFMNVCLIWIFVLLLGPERRNEWVAGLLLAVGTLYKPHMIFLAIPGIFVRLSMKKTRAPIRVLIVRLLSPIFVAWAICLGYFATTGRLKLFFDIMVLHNAHYAGNMLVNLGQGLSPQIFFPSFTWFLLPLVLLTALGFFRKTKKDGNLWFSLGVSLAATYLVVACSGKFFPHYYQLWMPLLCVGAAWGGLLAMEWKREMKSMALLLCLGILVAYEAPTYLLNAREWSVEKYGSWFVRTRELGEGLGRVLGPDETLYFWGDSASVYFYSHKRPTAGVVITWTAFSGPMRPILTNRLFNDLRRNHPDLITFDDLKFHDFYKHFLNKYRVWKYFPGKRYILLVEKGGKLEKRLRLKPLPRSASTSGT